MRLENVWLRYHRRGPWVLRETDVRIGPGEVAVVLGRNGVGKSTLLQVAAGVLRPTRGRVVDRPAAVGWVPERFPADQPFTVAHYLAAMGGMAGLAAPTARVAGTVARLRADGHQILRVRAGGGAAPGEPGAGGPAREAAR
ncbi:ABC transporter family protein [Micromonospora kangleipakensis]|uniref:ABC transporter family protein n=1 Tax=Micromonospora kangleipakensis TaxID=1077942 RepID=A0A4Q8B4I1_9ACTN|nr:ABC transporter family protein [Micromonospora kangleipakensis]